MIFLCEFDKFHTKFYATREKEILKSKHPPLQTASSPLYHMFYTPYASHMPFIFSLIHTVAIFIPNTALK